MNNTARLPEGHARVAPGGTCAAQGAPVNAPDVTGTPSTPRTARRADE